MTVSLGPRRLGDGLPPLVVAEIGANHNGSVDQAHNLIDLCADAGCEAVKFQTYTASDLLVDQDRVVTWGPPGNVQQERIGAMFDRLALPRGSHGEMFDHARERGMIAFSTPFSVDALEFLCELGAPAIKIASSDVSYVRLLNAAAQSGLPVIISNGKSTVGEFDAAVTVLQNNGNSDLVTLHCVASYPTEDQELNLRAMGTLDAMYPGALVGISDHTSGIVAGVAATALGAHVIEKHITYDVTATGPDHWFSLGPDQLEALVRDVHRCWLMMGSGRIEVTESEAAERRSSIRSLVLTRDVEAGDVLTEEVVDARRPGTGISPVLSAGVIGRSLRTGGRKGQVLQWRDLA